MFGKYIKRFMKKFIFTKIFSMKSFVIFIQLGWLSGFHIMFYIDECLIINVNELNLPL